jgi:ferredoxin
VAGSAACWCHRFVRRAKGQRSGISTFEGRHVEEVADIPPRPSGAAVVPLVLQDVLFLPVLVSCGGTASCSTCHVYLDPEVVKTLGDRSEDEIDLLEDDDFFRAESSLLSCQVAYDEQLDGITVTLAPEA